MAATLATVYDSPLEATYFKPVTKSDLTASFGGTAVGMVQTNSYRLNRLPGNILLTGAITIASKGTSTGVFEVQGLLSAGPWPSPIPVSVTGMASGIGHVIGRVVGSTLRLYKMVSGSRQQLTDADFVDGAVIEFNGVYPSV